MTNDLRGEDGSWVARLVHERHVQLHRDVRAGRDLVRPRPSGVELAPLGVPRPLQVHRMLQCEETQALGEGTFHLYRIT